jgi:ribosomal protein S18 acetylase RimI-like enzyme
VAVRIRGARVEDAPGIATVQVASWQAAYRHAFPPEYLASLSVLQREARWRKTLTESDEDVFVAEVEGEVVGFAAAAASRDGDAAAGRIGELHAIYVRPDCWGTGAGAALYDAALAALAVRGFGQATLWVLDSNTRARRFYECRDWATDGGVKQEKRGGTPINQVRYRRALKR